MEAFIECILGSFCVRQMIYLRLGENLVIWRSKKQFMVVGSSAEADFRAIARGICELMWLKVLFKEFAVLKSNLANSFFR